MTIRARTHGYTGWINMRLTPYEQSLNNIIMDILRGTNMKYLLQSYTGEKNEKFQSFENLTKEQLQTRVKWLLKDLIKYQVIADDIGLDTRMFAIRSAKHVFELLWRLVRHDILFLWERINFLAKSNDENLIQVPFTWVPVQKENGPNSKKTHPEISQLSGFQLIPGMMDVINGKRGSASSDPIEDENKKSEINKEDLFPDLKLLRSFGIREIELAEAPDPKACIIEMINIQLRTQNEGNHIKFTVSK